MRIALIGLLSLGMLGLGCKKNEEEMEEETPTTAAPVQGEPAAPAAPVAEEAPAAGGYKVIEVANGGTIAGTVKLKGAAPKLEDFKITKDTATCGKTKKNNRLVVAKGGGMSQVLVYLADIKEGAKPEAKEATIDQKSCEYSPHVQVAPVGAKLVVSNSDPILHNVHSMLGEVTVFNFAQPIQGQKTDHVLSKPGTLVAKCDAGHTWMNAVVHVAPNPYYVLTGDDGKYEIKNVPAGKYQIVAWHEGWKTTQTPTAINFSDPVEVKKDVQVEASKPSTVDFEIAAN